MAEPNLGERDLARKWALKFQGELGHGGGEQVGYAHGLAENRKHREHLAALDMQVFILDENWAVPMSKEARLAVVPMLAQLAAAREEAGRLRKALRQVWDESRFGPCPLLTGADSGTGEPGGFAGARDLQARLAACEVIAGDFYRSMARPVPSMESEIGFGALCLAHSKRLFSKPAQGEPGGESK